MRIEASDRLMAAKLAGYDAEEMTIKVKGTPEAMRVLANLLAAIEYNTNVGHSCRIGAFFDGDGADKLSFEGLPHNLGKEMAAALSSYGDGYLAEVSADRAFAHNSAYIDDRNQKVRSTVVYPEEK